MRRSARVVGYVRPGPQDPEGRRQITAIREAARSRTLRIVMIAVEPPNTGSRLDRPALHQALNLLAEGDAHGLVVSEFDRLTPRLADFSEIFRWFTEAGASLLSLSDFAMDTSTPEGQQVAALLAGVADWESRKLAQRAAEDLASLRSAGRRISRAAVADQADLADWVRSARAEGKTLQEIADRLNAAGIPTPRGGTRWRPSSLQAITGYRRPKPSRSQGLPPVRPRQGSSSAP